jgi:hypothetical protein
MRQILTFKRDAQGWQSQYDGKLVVSSRWLTYKLNQEGRSLNEHTLEITLEEMFGGFFVAHWLTPEILKGTY